MVTIDTTVHNQAMFETLQKMDKLKVAITRFKTDSTTGAPPATLAGLLSDVGPVGCTASYGASKMRGWCGPYLETLTTNDPTDYATDGWGTTFYYNVAALIATVRSWGPNKIDNAGGSDDITASY